MKIVRSVLLAGAFLCIGGAAAAQPGGDGPPREETRADATVRADQLFARLDANRDGRVTADEVTGAMGASRPGGSSMGAGGPGGMFDRLDTDHNGSLSRAEFAAMRPPMGGAEGPGGPGSGQGRGAGMLARMIGPDGLTRDEFSARMLQRFDRLDANHDGRITGEERQQARARMQEMRAPGSSGRSDPEGDQ